jgi:hypothetical protein
LANSTPACIILLASVLTLDKSRIEALAIFGEEWEIQYKPYTVAVSKDRCHSQQLQHGQDSILAPPHTT